MTAAGRTEEIREVLFRYVNRLSDAVYALARLEEDYTQYEIIRQKTIEIIKEKFNMTSIIAGDIAAKASNITLIEIRIARGLGGKGFLIFTGEISSVKSAMGSVTAKLGDEGEITSTAVIASPHKDLAAHLLG